MPRHTNRTSHKQLLQEAKQDGASRRDLRELKAFDELHAVGWDTENIGEGVMVSRRRPDPNSPQAKLIELHRVNPPAADLVNALVNAMLKQARKAAVR